MPSHNRSLLHAHHLPEMNSKLEECQLPRVGLPACVPLLVVRLSCVARAGAAPALYEAAGARERCSIFGDG